MVCRTLRELKMGNMVIISFRLVMCFWLAEFFEIRTIEPYSLFIQLKETNIQVIENVGEHKRIRKRGM